MSHLGVNNRNFVNTTGLAGEEKIVHTINQVVKDFSRFFLG